MQLAIIEIVRFLELEVRLLIFGGRGERRNFAFQECICGSEALKP